MTTDIALTLIIRTLLIYPSMAQLKAQKSLQDMQPKLNALKEKGFWVFGCDPEAPATVFELDARVLGDAQVVVLGAEGRGLRPGILRALDHRVRIPMEGRVASLNVATAAAVILFELRRRAGEKG